MKQFATRSFPVKLEKFNTNMNTIDLDSQPTNSLEKNYITTLPLYLRYIQLIWIVKHNSNTTEGSKRRKYKEKSQSCTHRIFGYIRKKNKREKKRQSSCDTFASTMSSRPEREPWIFTRATHTSWPFTTLSLPSFLFRILSFRLPIQEIIFSHPTQSSNTGEARNSIKISIIHNVGTQN